MTTVGGSITARPSAYAVSRLRGSTQASWSVSVEVPSACLALGEGCREEPRVEPTLLERRGDPVGPRDEVGHREPQPALLLDLTHGRRQQGHGLVGADAHGIGQARSPHPRRGSARASSGSTPPPGKTYIDGANAIVDTRRWTNTAGPSTVSRTTSTVAAPRGSRGSPGDASQARAFATHASERGAANSRHGIRKEGSVGDVDDDLDLDGGVEGENSDTHGRPGVHTLVAEGGAEQAHWHR